ncbi:hypothetical protein [[Phormidium ambiguum] IAM M-71]|uniref:hypothetical protein n=1 Tax=[Phormidium ambiguum] IAM M-71 TaxID=454136 RepID=UPI0011613A96|nr:hypothetical protein [Phormidium ambiguum]
MDSVASKLPRMIVYIEPELLEKTRLLAKKQRRSTSALVCYLLEQAIKEDERKSDD